MDEKVEEIVKILNTLSGEEELEILIIPGTAKKEQIGEFLSELSILYRMLGGSGIDFTPGEIRQNKFVGS